MKKSDLKMFRSSMRAIERRVARSLKEQTACCGVTSAQCHVLLEISALKPVGIAELSARLGLDPSTLSRTVDGLVRAGLLERSENPADRRACLLQLTEQGSATCRSIEDFCDRFYTDMLKPIPRKKQYDLLQAMALLVEIFAAERGPGSREHCPDRPRSISSKESLP